jgi:hypothetical protein
VIGDIDVVLGGAFGGNGGEPAFVVKGKVVECGGKVVGIVLGRTLLRCV